MTRQQFRAFIRALLATFLAGMMLWLFHRIGVQITVPIVTNQPT